MQLYRVFLCANFLPSQTLIATIIFCSLQVHSSGVASWSLKELTQEFYGLTIAYEEVRPVVYYNHSLVLSESTTKHNVILLALLMAV